MFAVKANIYEVLLIPPGSIDFYENLAISQRRKAPNFSALVVNRGGGLVQNIGGGGHTTTH